MGLPLDHVKDSASRVIVLSDHLRIMREPNDAGDNAGMMSIYDDNILQQV